MPSETQIPATHFSRPKETLVLPNMADVKDLNHLKQKETEIKRLRNKVSWIKRTERSKTLKELAHNKKLWLKMVECIEEPAYCEMLITQLEARRRQLKPNFQSETPMG